MKTYFLVTVFSLLWAQSEEIPSVTAPPPLPPSIEAAENKGAPSSEAPTANSEEIPQEAVGNQESDTEAPLPPPSSNIPSDSLGVNNRVGTDYVYSPDGKRDPFKPYAPPKPKVPPKKVVLDILKEPLQKFPVSALTVVGIIWNTAFPRAMIVDPEGVVHVVRMRTFVGNRGGRVARIRESEVVVVEPAQEGEELAKAVSLTIKR